MNPLVVIPARGGSKGVPNKNIKLLGGKPLIIHTLDEARKIFDDNKIIVSTDDVKIKALVEQTGFIVPFLRPAELATDSADTYGVLLHALTYAESLGNFPDILILLQPTSPFRNAFHIKEALSLYTSDLDMVVSVKETKANPYYLLREENENGWLIKSKDGAFTRRQDCPKVYELNGAIYVINVASLKQKGLSEFSKAKKYLMDEISSHDIDSGFDWLLAEVLINRSYFQNS